MHEARVVEVRGYADRQLYNPLDPEDTRNGRVSITLLFEEAVAAREKLSQEKLLNRGFVRLRFTRLPRVRVGAP
jgi:hypothetical protein